MTGTDGQRAVTRRPRIEDVAVHSALNDGTAVCLRTITPDDAPLIRDGIARLSAESRYLRFFSPAPVLPDAVVVRLAAVDGHDHKIGREEWRERGGQSVWISVGAG